MDILGAFVFPHDELEEELCILTGEVDEVENELSGERSLSNNRESLGDTYSESDMEQSNHFGMEDDIRYKIKGCKQKHCSRPRNVFTTQP